MHFKFVNLRVFLCADKVVDRVYYVRYMRSIDFEWNQIFVKKIIVHASGINDTLL